MPIGLYDGDSTFSKDYPTFVAYASDVAIAQNKSMISILNTSSTVKIRIREIKIINTQTTAITGVVADFRLLRITGHSAGTSITPSAHDTSDSLNGGVTTRTGSTVSGEGTAIHRRWQLSSDEWGTGTLDVEAASHDMQIVTNLAKCFTSMRPITLNTNEGFTIKQVTNSTAGTFDLAIFFTQEEI